MNLPLFCLSRQKHLFAGRKLQSKQEISNQTFLTLRGMRHKQEQTIATSNPNVTSPGLYPSYQRGSAQCAARKLQLQRSRRRSKTTPTMHPWAFFCILDPAKLMHVCVSPLCQAEVQTTVQKQSTKRLQASFCTVNISRLQTVCQCLFEASESGWKFARLR